MKRAAGWWLATVALFALMWEAPSMVLWSWFLALLVPCAITAAVLTRRAAR